jgi:hypothetical protein
MQVHEFGHAVMDLGLHANPLKVLCGLLSSTTNSWHHQQQPVIGFPLLLQGAIKEAYQAAHASGRYDTSCYMMENESE